MATIKSRSNQISVIDGGSLDTTADLGVSFGCRNGVCGACVHVITEGQVDQGSQMAVDDERVEEGYTVLCIGRPLSDVTLRTPEDG
mgnify:CR=1 FL=1